MSEFTKGEWKMEGGWGDNIVLPNGRWYMARGWLPPAEALANARLIIAAPEMYSLICDLLHLDALSDTLCSYPALTKAKNIVDKVEGRITERQLQTEQQRAPRKDKDTYYLDIAEAVLARSTCLRRKYGAVIVRNDEIISTGYNGAPRGLPNCCDIGYCYREAKHIPHGKRYEDCKSVHAEANAIISASRQDMIGSTLYLVGREADGSLVPDIAPCLMCTRLIINAGIATVVTRAPNNNINKKDMRLGVQLARYSNGSPL